MSRLFLSIALIVTSSAAPLRSEELPHAKPEDVGVSSAGLSKVDEVMNGLVKNKRLAGGIVMIARRGSIVHFQSYGLADIESKRAMKKDAILRFYSMSKAITSAAVMILVDEGKLRVDAPVSDYLPEFKALKVSTDDGLVVPKREMTIADLLRHTSGLTYGRSHRADSDRIFKELGPLNPKHSIEVMSSKLARVPLAYHPGQDWTYGVSIDVLGRVIEVASGQKLDAFLSKRIFKPLDMPDTGFYVPAEKHDRYAQVYNSDSEGTLTVGDNSGRADFSKPKALLSGGGGLVSTARDYMRFLMMIQQGGRLGDVRILSAKSVEQMTSDQLPRTVPNIYFGQQQRIGVGFGFGFSVRTKRSKWDPQGRVGEYGWGGLASTHYWVSPKDDLIVITLEQTLPYSFMTEFALKGVIYDAIMPNSDSRP